MGQRYWGLRATVAAGTLLRAARRYGSDHDPTLMNNIAEAGGGTFTFVSGLEFVSDSFSACIGAITDVVRGGLGFGPEGRTALPESHPAMKMGRGT